MMTSTGQVGSADRLDRFDRVLYTRWVRTATALTAAAYAVVTVAGLLTHDGFWYGFFSQAPTTLVAAGAYLLARRDRAGLAALITVAAVWIELHADLPFVGVRASGLVAFPVVIMAIGILRGGRAAFALATLTSFTVPLTTMGGFWLRGVPLPDLRSMVYLVVVGSASMFAVAALVELGLESFDRVLAQAIASESRFAALLTHAPVGILAADADGYVVFASPVMQELLATDERSLRGKELRRVLREAFPDPEHQDRIRALLKQEDNFVPLTLITAGGRTLDLTADLTRVGWADGSVGSQVILRDVTEQKRAEENERLLQAQLEHAQRLEAVGRLAGGVAHDFNNLMTVVGVSAEMLLDEGDEHVQEVARDILDAKVRGTALTKRLLAFARKEPIQMRRLGLADVICESVPLMRRFLTEDIKLSVDVAREMPPVFADPSHVEQLLANLVINARDALAGAGHVKLAAYPPGSVRSWAGGESWVVDDGFVELSVEDDGVGMDPEVRERIFEPFFTTKPRERGTGLGLASVHGIMNQSGGKIRVLSEPGVGTCMLLYWPVAPAESAGPEDGEA